MVNQMTNQNYLMINELTNIVDNVCVWDGNPDTWQPPSGYLMLVDDITPALVWVLDESIDDFVLQSQLGAGSIGFTWNGIELTTNEPKPAKPDPQPQVIGAQTL